MEHANHISLGKSSTEVRISQAIMAKPSRRLLANQVNVFPLALNVSFLSLSIVIQILQSEITMDFRQWRKDGICSGTAVLLFWQKHTSRPQKIIVFLRIFLKDWRNVQLLVNLSPTQPEISDKDTVWKATLLMVNFWQLLDPHSLLCAETWHPVTSLYPSSAMAEVGFWT